MTIEDLIAKKHELEITLGSEIHSIVSSFVDQTKIPVKEIRLVPYFTDARREPEAFGVEVTLELGL